MSQQHTATSEQHKADIIGNHAGGGAKGAKKNGSEQFINGFKIIKKIGEGAFSVVYKVVRQSDQQEYALKQVKMMKLSEKEKINALNEVRILASIKHENVIAYKEAFFEENSSTLCIVMEYADAGDLYNRILEHKKNGTYFEEHEIWNALKQMTKGLKSLHELNILHRDLKSANVFMNNDGNVKMGDLNVSKVAKENGLLFTQTGTPYYASPEVWKDQPYDYKSDIWSLGCVIYEMTTLRPPFKAANMDQLYKVVLSGNYPKIPVQYSRELSMLIGNLIVVSPHQRPSCDKILKMISKYKKICIEQGISHQIQTSNSKAESKLLSQDVNLLKTIELPRNLSQLVNSLPKSSYDEQESQFLNFGQVLLNSGQNQQAIISSKQSRKSEQLRSQQSTTQSSQQHQNQIPNIYQQRVNHIAQIQEQTNKQCLLSSEAASLRSGSNQPNLDNLKSQTSADPPNHYIHQSLRNSHKNHRQNIINLSQKQQQYQLKSVGGSQAQQNMHHQQLPPINEISEFNTNSTKELPTLHVSEVTSAKQQQQANPYQQDISSHKQQYHKLGHKHLQSSQQTQNQLQQQNTSPFSLSSQASSKQNQILNSQHQLLAKPGTQSHLLQSQNQQLSCSQKVSEAENLIKDINARNLLPMDHIPSNPATLLPNRNSQLISHSAVSSVQRKSVITNPAHQQTNIEARQSLPGPIEYPAKSVCMTSKQRSPSNSNYYNQSLPFYKQPSQKKILANENGASSQRINTLKPIAQERTGSHNHRDYGTVQEKESEKTGKQAQPLNSSRQQQQNLPLSKSIDNSNSHQHELQSVSSEVQQEQTLQILQKQFNQQQLNSKILGSNHQHHQSQDSSSSIGHKPQTQNKNQSHKLNSQNMAMMPSSNSHKQIQMISSKNASKNNNNTLNSRHASSASIQQTEVIQNGNYQNPFQIRDHPLQLKEQIKLPENVKQHHLGQSLNQQPRQNSAANILLQQKENQQIVNTSKQQSRASLAGYVRQNSQEHVVHANSNASQAYYLGEPQCVNLGDDLHRNPSSSQVRNKYRKALNNHIQIQHSSILEQIDTAHNLNAHQDHPAQDINSQQNQQFHANPMILQRQSTADQNPSYLHQKQSILLLKENMDYVGNTVQQQINDSQSTSSIHNHGTTGPQTTQNKSTLRKKYAGNNQTIGNSRRHLSRGRQKINCEDLVKSDNLEHVNKDSTQPQDPSVEIENQSNNLLHQKYTSSGQHTIQQNGRRQNKIPVRQTSCNNESSQINSKQIHTMQVAQNRTKLSQQVGSNSLGRPGGQQYHYMRNDSLHSINSQGRQNDGVNGKQRQLTRKSKDGIIQKHQYHAQILASSHQSITDRPSQYQNSQQQQQGQTQEQSHTINIPSSSIGSIPQSHYNTNDGMVIIQNSEGNDHLGQQHGVDKRVLLPFTQEDEKSNSLQEPRIIQRQANKLKNQLSSQQTSQERQVNRSSKGDGKQGINKQYNSTRQSHQTLQTQGKAANPNNQNLQQKHSNQIMVIQDQHSIASSNLPNQMMHSQAPNNYSTKNIQSKHSKINQQNSSTQSSSQCNSTSQLLTLNNNLNSVTNKVSGNQIQQPVMSHHNKMQGKSFIGQGSHHYKSSLDCEFAKNIEDFHIVHPQVNKN